MSKISQKLKNLPTSPGVYIFKGKTGEVLYVGKATSLKDRVGSYFVGVGTGRDLSLQYVRPIEIMIAEVADIETRKTDTVLEAYILEQELIKKIQPKYNVDGKDDKSFSYVLLTKENFPRFEMLRGTDIAQISKSKLQISNKIQITNSKFKNIKFAKIYGPYTSKKQIEIVLKILRKIFPYHAKPQQTEKGCLDHQMGLCPGPYAGEISKCDYAKNIRGIKMILEGKKKNLITKMKKEMAVAAEKEDFEKAASLRNQIFALQHVQDMAMISSDHNPSVSTSTSSHLPWVQGRIYRIEGYDISNISGQYAVGSMVVFDNTNGQMEPNKNEYRKFKIKTVQGANDVAMMEEVLTRRFKNAWLRPNVILLDGGVGHLNIARRVLRRLHLDIPILAVAKGPTRKKLDLRTFGSVPEIPENIIAQIRDEAHRFAIGYHRKLRRKGSLE
ncbi:MAG: UvrB/UvrC motif-containing protein [Parcubacteria group bacterium]